MQNNGDISKTTSKINGKMCDNTFCDCKLKSKLLYIK